MKLARTIHLDVSDTNVFTAVARPGEWAVTGTFAFADSDPSAWTNKDKIAFRDGWMGTESFGRSTFVQVTTIAQEHYEEIVRCLAGHIFESYGAPGMIDALEAARTEVDDMAKICEHPVGTLLAIERTADDQAITERTRVITPPSEEFHTRIWAIDDDDGDGDSSIAAQHIRLSR
mgnify:CR=1 FL=1